MSIAPCKSPFKNREQSLVPSLAWETTVTSSVSQKATTSRAAASNSLSLYNNITRNHVCATVGPNRTFFLFQSIISIELIRFAYTHVHMSIRFKVVPPWNVPPAGFCLCFKEPFSPSLDSLLLFPGKPMIALLLRAPSFFFFPVLLLWIIIAADWFRYRVRNINSTLLYKKETWKRYFAEGKVTCNCAKCDILQVSRLFPCLFDWCHEDLVEI